MNATPVATQEHYRKLERIGAGGMGIVWKAEDANLGRTVALKFLAPELTRDPDAKIRFVREARAAALLDHPNICTIYDVGETDDGATYIAMPYYEGNTLKQLIEAGPLAIDRALTFGSQIARGLAKAHAAGIVHRDIKPANIIITNDGVAKILDFGLARLADATSITRPQTTLGTLAYMAPEQLRGDIVQPAADVWSLGVVLFEMLTARRPFGGEHNGAVMHAILNSDPSSLAGLRPDMPPETAALLLHMLQKDPALRTISADEIASRLDAARASHPRQTACPDSVTFLHSAPTDRGQVSLMKGSRRWLVAAFAVVLVAAVAALLLRVNRESPASPRSAPRAGVAPPRTIAVLPIGNDDVESQYTSDGITMGLIDELSTSPALRVTALSSTMRYRGSKADLPTIGRELGVSTLVTGAFRKENENVALRLEMIDTRDGSQLWAKNYAYPINNTVNMRRRVLADASMRLGITGTDRVRRAPSPEAWDLYLRGRFLWHVRTRQNLLSAIALFEQAIAIDPEFAQAWSGLGNAYGGLVGNSLVPGQEEETEKKAEAAIARALALDDTLAEAWASRAAGKHSYRWDFAGADRDFQRAIQLNPSYASAHQWYASFLSNTGHPVEARREIDLAWQLDPYSLPVNNFVCWNRFTARKYGEAIEHARQAQSTDPELKFGPCISWSYAMKGDYDGVIRTVRNFRPGFADALAAALQRGGPREFWLQRAAHMNGHEYTEAACYAMAGDRDKAFELLERAYAIRQAELPWMYVDPRMDPLRADPRFEELARRIGLPQVKASNTR